MGTRRVALDGVPRKRKWFQKHYGDRASVLWAEAPKQKNSASEDDASLDDDKQDGHVQERRDVIPTAVTTGFTDKEWSAVTATAARNARAQLAARGVDGSDGDADAEVKKGPPFKRPRGDGPPDHPFFCLKGCGGWKKTKNASCLAPCFNPAPTEPPPLDGGGTTPPDEDKIYTTADLFGLDKKARRTGLLDTIWLNLNALSVKIKQANEWVMVVRDQLAELQSELEDGDEDAARELDAVDALASDAVDEEGGAAAADEEGGLADAEE